MITEVRTAKGRSAITSDHWHVVHSRWTADAEDRPFVRSVHSEHEDRDTCRKAARELRAKLAQEAGRVPAHERDEVLVRRPNYRSLKRAKPRLP